MKTEQEIKHKIRDVEFNISQLPETEESIQIQKQLRIEKYALEWVLSNDN